MSSDQRFAEMPDAQEGGVQEMALQDTPIDSTFVVYSDVTTKIADGAVLFADLYLPAVDGLANLGKKYETVLLRTPYGRKTPDQLMTAKFYTAHGYAVFIQDARGTGGSEGKFEPMLNESWGKNKDGAETLAWLIRQPWSTGRAVTAGPSYLGAVQLLLAAMDPPGFETGFVQAPAVNQFAGNWVYGDGGTLDLLTAVPWADMMAKSLASRADPFAPHEALVGGQFPDFRKIAMSTQNIPLRDLPILKDVSFWRDWLDNWDEPAFFDVNDVFSRLSNLSKPLLLYGGWYDLFLKNTISAFSSIARNGATPHARTGTRLIVGPWGHGIPLEGGRQFPDSNVNFFALGVAWMDHQLSGEAAPLEAPVTLYVMGENRWRSESAWPLVGTVRTRYYLHSDGKANGADGDGGLRADLPTPSQRPDQYQSDPANPVISIGGHSLIGGSADQRPTEARDDVLVYTSQPLEEDVEVTGEVTATLYAATSGTDTDWYITLVDVSPDGAAYNVAHGNLRARYRFGRAIPRPVAPGEVAEYRINLWSTSNVFKKGHRIRVHISSTDFPNSDVNPNTYMDMTRVSPKDYVVAAQTVFHDLSRSSFIELPIIPNERARHWTEAPPLAPEIDPATFVMPAFNPVKGDKNDLPSAP